MKKNTSWILACSFALAAAGFLLPFWPLSVVGVLILALSGRWVYAVGLGLLLDLAYGAPLGTARFLFFPFMLVAFVAMLVRWLGGQYLFEKTPPDTL